MRILCPLILVFLLFSCSMEKRHYRGGYAVAWNTNRNNVPAQTVVSHAPDKMTLTASASGTIPDPVLFAQPNTEIFAAKCDTIFLKSGAKLLAKVSEVNETEVKYKACDERGGEGFVFQKKEINRISYANGQEDKFTAEEPVGQGTSGQGRNGALGSDYPPRQDPGVPSGPGFGNANNNADQQEISKEADKSLWFGLASCAPFFIISAVFSAFSIRSGRRVAEKTKSGKDYKRSRIGTILAIFNLAVRILIVVVLIVFLVGII